MELQTLQSLQLAWSALGYMTCLSPVLAANFGNLHKDKQWLVRSKAAFPMRPALLLLIGSNYSLLNIVPIDAEDMRYLGQRKGSVMVKSCSQRFLFDFFLRLPKARGSMLESAQQQFASWEKSTKHPLTVDFPIPQGPSPCVLEVANLLVATAVPLGPETYNGSTGPGGVVGLSLGDAILPGQEPPFSVFTVLVVMLLAVLIAATFLWNLLVLVTILRVSTFHHVPHNLLGSTAILDALVAAMVMPLNLVSKLSAGRPWCLVRSLCHMWISLDVLCCTASIWNVAAIALDRYWTMMPHLQYSLRACCRTSALMIALTWALVALIALAPLLFSWGEVYNTGHQWCQVSQEPSDAVFSTGGALYLPLGIVLFVYWNTSKAAKFRFGRCRRQPVLPLPATVQNAMVRSQLENSIRKVSAIVLGLGFDLWKNAKFESMKDKNM
ncbi:5-hydroxytryptamine receptor 5B-like [Perognathus longimembris pacificus]|uniref:5-hydroxytryptamine receptor 5B-like n=1 Tax=Perognathus longimembris pacificus TaxID=214514 RepID=UPI0020192B71|nr:5-hydroxytryptamine receptor 5B-like [Perognathus longimembris pacificus]